MAREKRSIEEKSIWPDARQMLAKAERDGVETAWYGFGRAKLQRLLACLLPYCSVLALNQITFL